MKNKIILVISIILINFLTINNAKGDDLQSYIAFCEHMRSSQKAGLIGQTKQESFAFGRCLGFMEMGMMLIVTMGENNCLDNLSGNDVVDIFLEKAKESIEISKSSNEKISMSAASFFYMTFFLKASRCDI